MRGVTREQVIEVVNDLPESKLASAYDYVVFLQRSIEPSDAELAAEDELWESAFANDPEKLRAMAREARAEYAAGLTTGISDEGPELTPAP